MKKHSKLKNLMGFTPLERKNKKNNDPAVICRKALFNRKDIPLCVKQVKFLTGFTLIELLISVCIFAIIAGALGGVLFSGVKLWRRAESFGYSQTNILLELELFSRRIRQSLRIENIPFKGEDSFLEFPTLSADSILKLRYSFDPANKSLICGRIKYEDILSAEEADQQVFDQKSLFKVKEAVFSYLIFDSESHSFLWSSSLDAEQIKDNIPAAVKISIIDEDGKKFEKIVFIPVHEEYI